MTLHSSHTISDTTCMQSQICLLAVFSLYMLTLQEKEKVNDASRNSINLLRLMGFGFCSYSKIANVLRKLFAFGEPKIIHFE